MCLHSHYETLFYVHSPFQTEILSSEKTKHTADINNRILSVLIKSWAYGPAVRFVSLCASPTPYFTSCVIPCPRLKEGREYIKGRSIEVWVLTLWHEGALRICPVVPGVINQPWPWPADTAENISRDHTVKERGGGGAGGWLGCWYGADWPINKWPRVMLRTGSTLH